jgi:hypothetical protein
MARRAYIPVPEDLERAVRERPEEYGFTRGMSAASIYARMIERGARALKEERERRERIELYRAWANDDESHDAVAETMQQAFEDVVL